MIKQFGTTRSVFVMVGDSYDDKVVLRYIFGYENNKHL